MTRAVIFLLIAALAAAKGDNNCVKRIVGPNAIVCVCNATYCDYVSEIKPQGEQYVLYTSTESGERFNVAIGNFSNQPMSGENVLTVNSNQTFQTIMGFGGAMTDAAAININTLSNSTRENLLESYYGGKGSKYIFCRIPIAGTDFSTRPYTYDDVPNDLTLSHFSLVEEDNYKINYLHRIKSIMPKPDSLKIFTTSWSAPGWMKNTGDIRWGSLKHEYYQLYANYIRKFFDAYKVRGIDIWGMTPGNEPLDGIFPFFPFNAMLWTPATEGIFSTNYLEPTLSEAGYNLTYMAMDDQRFLIPWFSDTMFKDDKAKKMFSGTAFHWYADFLFSPTRLDELQEKYPDKFILMTEACTGSNPLEKEKVKLGSWERGEEYLWDIIQNLSHWTTGWVDWNLALDKFGAPNWAKNFVDSPIIVMPETDEFYKQPMYYALCHISKFVPPNSKRIYSTGLENIKDVEAIAFSTPEQNIVVVAINRDDKSYNITIQDKVTNNMVNLQLSAKSFSTLVYQEPQ